MTYVASLVSGSGSIPPPIAAPTQFLCGLALKTCPQVAIHDKNLNKTVSASPPPSTDTVVGEQEALTVQHVTGTGTGTGYAISGTPAWTVGGSAYTAYAFGDGTMPTTAPMPVPIAASDLMKTSPTPFYWFSKGTDDISVTAQLTGTVANGAEISDFTPMAKYNVMAPTAVKIDGTPGTVYSTYTAKTVTVGTKGPGMTYDFSATAPTGGDGQLVATQSLLKCSTEVVGATTKYASTNVAALALDNVVFYDPPVPVSAGSSATWTSNDNPGSTYDYTAMFKSVMRADSFQTTFLYQPTGVGNGVGKSVWVPLGQLKWKWSGASTLAKGVWSPATGSPTRTSSTGLTFPAWSSILLNGNPTFGTTPNC